MPSSLKVANAAACPGEPSDAVARLVAAQPDLDFLTLDYLAKDTLARMTLARAERGAPGFVPDIVAVLHALVPFYQSGGKAKIVTNAGALDPLACALACAEMLRAAGLGRLRVAAVTGDDVLILLQRATTEDCGPENCHIIGGTLELVSATAALTTYNHLETDAYLSTVADRLICAHAYLGAAPVAAALRSGADLVITGHVADPALTTGPCLAHFGWPATEFNRLAGATAAGQLLEGSVQIAPDGFLIAEIADDGSCVLRATAGNLSFENAKEQLLRVPGNAGNLVTPDVVASFLTAALEPVAGPALRLSGATGRATTTNYKISATYRSDARTAGAPPAISYWPCLVDRTLVNPAWQFV